ncbi:uncharacterized protein [Nicotiana tomentosiformis]|uniref:uncharacterized protein n=1 Tax=Nicotiana tomentosiformis TaxID=4098 RepID=UPI00051C39C6|nr:uncharacterized protein LOC104098367 [Nicotiana tomentosiformis]
MEKGRGRGRGRPKKQPSATFISSVVTCYQPLMEKSTSEITTPPSVPIADPVTIGGTACEFGSTSKNPGISKRLDLNTPVTICQLATSSQIPFNGTVKLVNQAQNQVSILGSSEKSTVEEVAITNESARPKAPWITLFQKNRFATNGDGPGYNAMKRYINLHWSHVTEPELFYHDEGYYIIRFQSVADAREILCAGPYSIANNPIILKPWTPDFDFTEEFPTVMPLWVKFPKLPMSRWGVGSLSRIASVIGTPIFADECTAKQTRVFCARMLIELNVTKELPTEIMVMDPYGKKFLQAITYDWKPAYCDKYLVVGHKCTNQARPVMQQPNQTRRTRSNKVITQEWRTKGHIHNATGPQNVTPSEEQQQDGNIMEVADQRGTT